LRGEDVLSKNAATQVGNHLYGKHWLRVFLDGCQSLTGASRGSIGFTSRKIHSSALSSVMRGYGDILWRADTGADGSCESVVLGVRTL
jgi:hypothetical protein